MEKLDSLRENDWATVLEGVIAGVSHHISNRVSVLAGVADILGADESIPPILRALVDEIPKLEEGVRLLGLLGPDPQEAEEAFEVQRVVADAVKLAKMSPSREGEATITVALDGVPPMVAKQSVVLRELVSALVRFQDRDVIIRWVTEGDALGVTVDEWTVWGRALT